MEFERSFVKAGGLLLAGNDPTGYGGVLAGLGDQREVELLVEAGFTPLEGIQIASVNGARFLGVDSRLGALAPGVQADMVVVRGNPAENISDIGRGDRFQGRRRLRLEQTHRVGSRRRRATVNNSRRRGDPARRRSPTHALLRATIPYAGSVLS